MALPYWATLNQSEHLDGEVFLRVTPLGAAIYILAYTPIILLTIFSNGMVIFAFARSASIRSRTSNYYILSLAITDLLTGLVAVPLGTTNRLVVSDLTCSLRTRTLIFLPAYSCVSLSLSFLLGLTIDRFIAISRPLRYPSIMTPRRTFYLICWWWAFGLTFASLPVWIFGEDSYQWVCGVDQYDATIATAHALAGVLLVPLWLTVLSSVYARIFCISYYTTNEATKARSSKEGGLSKQRRMRTTVTCAIVLGTFAVCYLPSSYKFVYENFYATDIKRLLTVQTACEMLSYAASFANPFIYGWRNQQFRCAYKNILRSFGRRKRAEERHGNDVSMPTVSFRVTKATTDSTS